MDFLSELIQSLGSRIDTSLGGQFDSGKIGSEYFFKAENNATVKGWRDRNGQRIIPTNAKEFGGFHAIKSVKPVKGISQFSGMGKDFDIRASFILFGRQHTDFNFLWKLTNEFEKSIDCPKAGADIEVKEIILDKYKIIKAHFPDIEAGLLDAQFDLELIEFDYTLKATNCEC